MIPSRPVRVVRVYHSGVVAAWRQRDRELRALGVGATLLSARRWNEGGRDVELRVAPDERGVVTGATTVGRHPYLFAYGPLALARALRRDRSVDVLDIHEEPASLAAFEVWSIARLVGLRAPFCLYCAQNIEKRYPPPFRWIERFLLRRAAAVHTCNEEAGRILRRKGFAGIVRNLGLGVDVDRFHPDPAPPPAAGARAGDGLRIGYVGRLEAHKGVDVLVAALALVPEASLAVIGDGPERPAIEAMVAERGLAGRVGIRGFLDHDDLPAFYRSIDVLAVPSLETPGWIEQFGRVAVEAMASGRPVVASASGSLVEVVGDAGVLVPPGDAAALAEALRSLAPAGTRSRLAELAVERARTWSWPEVASRHLVLYEDVVASSEGIP